MADLQGMNDVSDDWREPAALPARATDGVTLARPGMRIETIAVVAAGRHDDPAAACAGGRRPEIHTPNAG